MKKKRHTAGRFAVLAVLAALAALAGRLEWGWRQVHAHEEGETSGRG